MSNCFGRAINPLTNEEEPVYLIDDYFGKHKYAVIFDDGRVYPIEKVVIVEGFRDDRIE